MKKFGIILDPLETLIPEKDSCLCLVDAMNQQGHEVFFTHSENLFIKDGQAYARWRAIHYKSGDKTVKETLDGDEKVEPLSNFDMILVRKSPPFDDHYLAMTYILDFANTIVFNAPQALRQWNEKLAVQRWPDLAPETWVSSDVDFLAAKIQDAGGLWITKPIDGCAGQGVYKLDAKNKDECIKYLNENTSNGKNFTILQKYIPEITQGDKRVILLDGKPIGQMKRIPPSGGFLSHVSRGATAVPCDLSDKDWRIIDHLAPIFTTTNGLPFVALDIVDEYLLEINVTCPAGTKAVAEEMGHNIHQDIIEHFVEYIDNDGQQNAALKIF